MSSEKPAMDRQQADAIARALLDQPRAQQAAQAERLRARGAAGRWRLPAGLALLGFFAGRVSGELLGGGGFVTGWVGMVVGGLTGLWAYARRRRYG